MTADRDLEAEATQTRSTTISLFGKSDAEVRFRVDDATYDLLQKEAQRHGLTANDLARMKLLISVHGIDHVASLAKDLVMRVAGSGQEAAR